MSKMPEILPFDEINAFQERLVFHLGRNGQIKSKSDEDDIIDELLDIFLLSFANGVRSSQKSLSSDAEPTAKEIEDVIYKPINGLSWVDRVRDLNGKDNVTADLMRIANTEAHRDGNEAAYVIAQKAGATKKRWVCTFNNSRDTHIYLNGTELPMDAEFYTYLGNKAQFPGQFGVAEEDCNCQCYLRFS